MDTIELIRNCKFSFDLNMFSIMEDPYELESAKLKEKTFENIGLPN